MFENQTDTATQKLNVTEYCLRKHSQEHPDKIALIVADAVGIQQSWSYKALYEAVGKLTAGLKSFGLPKGSIVTIQAGNSFYTIMLFLSAMAAGLVPNPVLSSCTKEELEWILNDSNSRALFQIGPFDLSLNLPKNCLAVSSEHYQELKHFTLEDIVPATLANDPAFVFYTSGSSGKPKGVLHAHRAILGRHPSIVYWLGLSGEDVVMQTDNISWTFTMFTGLLDPLSVGACAVVFTPSSKAAESEEEILPEIWLQLIQIYRVTVLVSSPDIYNKIIHMQNPHAYPVPSLRLAGSAGAPLFEEVEKSWEAIFHLPIYSALGMSELSTFISLGPDIPIKGESIGKIQPGRKVTILPIDNGDQSIGPDIIGMLAIHKTEMGFMLGYLSHNEEDAGKFRGDWFLTQDLVSCDSEGYLNYYGRADNILKVSGGFRVSPVEIEKILEKCTLVTDIACGTIWDPENNSDILVAYIVSSDATEQAANQIYELAASHLSDYKIPRVIYFVSQLPRNPRGKIIRKELKNLEPLSVFKNEQKVQIDKKERD